MVECCFAVGVAAVRERRSASCCVGAGRSSRRAQRLRGNDAAGNGEDVEVAEQLGEQVDWAVSKAVVGGDGSGAHRGIPPLSGKPRMQMPKVGGESTGEAPVGSEQADEVLAPQFGGNPAGPTVEEPVVSKQDEMMAELASSRAKPTKKMPAVTEQAVDDMMAALASHRPLSTAEEPVVSEQVDEAPGARLNGSPTMSMLEENAVSEEADEAAVPHPSNNRREGEHPEPHLASKVPKARKADDGATMPPGGETTGEFSGRKAQQSRKPWHAGQKQNRPPAGGKAPDGGHSPKFHLQALILKRKTVAAREELLRLRDVDTALKDWNRSLDACAEKKNPELADEILEGMAHQGVDLDTVSYTTLIKLHARCGALWRVKETWADMKAHGVEPNVHTYNAYLYCLRRSKDTQPAKDLVLEMESLSIEPTITTYVSCLCVCGQAGDEQGARSCLRQMRDKGMEPNSHTYSRLVRDFAKRRNQTFVEELEADMKQREIEMEAIGKVGMIELYAAMRKEAKVNSILRDFDEGSDGPRTDAFNAAMRGYMRVRGIREAERLFNADHEKVTPDKYTLSMTVKLFGQTGDLEKLQRAVQWLRSHKVEPDDRGYVDLIHAFGKANDVKAAAHILSKMQQRGVEPSLATYNVLLNVFAQEGDLESLKQVFNRMKRQQIEPDIITYNTLITAFSKIGNVKGAETLLREMEQHNHKPDACTYALLMRTLIESGQFDRVSGVLEVLRSKGLRENAPVYRNLIEAYIRGGRLEDAESALEEMIDDNVRPFAQAFTRMLNAYHALGRHEDAVACFDRMLVLSERPSPTDFSLCVSSLVKLDELKLAEKRLYSAYKLIGGPPQLVAFNSLISGHARHGDWERAVEFYEKIPLATLEPDNVTFSILIWMFRKLEMQDKVDEYVGIARSRAFEIDASFSSDSS